MTATTTYDVMLRYRMGNEATKEAENLNDHLQHASHSAHGLGDILGHVGLLAGGVFGIHGAYESLIKFNSEVDNAKISLTAMMEGGFGGSFQWARGQAEAMYSEFQKFSQQTPMTTQEMLEFGRGVAQATQQAGGSIKDIVTVTEMGAVAAKAYGFEASLASREVSEMLQGNIRSTEPFTKALAGAGHKSLEELRAMNAEQRLEWLKVTLTSPALKDAVASMGASFSGVTSTFEDKMQILLGKVGRPLFDAITNELGRWNEWIDKNSVAIAQFGREVGTELVSAFGAVKSVFGFIWEHADTFITIGKVWAAIKIGNMLGGGLLGGGGTLTGMLGNLGTSTSKLGAGQVLGPAMMAGMGGYELAKMLGADEAGKALGGAFADLTGRTNEYYERQEQVINSMNKLDAATQGAADRMGGISPQSQLQGQIDFMQARIDAMKWSQEHDGDVDAVKAKWKAAGIDEDEVRKAGGGQGFIDKEAARQGRDQGMGDLANTEASGFIASSFLTLSDFQRQTLNETKAQTEIFQYLNNHLQRGIPVDVAEIIGILKSNTADPENKHVASSDKPKVNVTIHRIEVASDDPDRFVFGMVSAFRDAAKNPSSAVNALREG